MNKRIDLTKLGGYPLAQEDLDWLQQSYREAFAGLAGLIGDKVIISGMQESSGNVTAGWVSIAGELLPFAPGTIGTGEFIIDETVTPLVFDDGVSKNVLYERVARFSSGGLYQYADLKRPGSIKEMWQRGDVKEIDCDAAYLAANFDVTGLGINERTGWAICNGSNGTRNRKGRVSVQFDSAQTEFDLLGETGGAKVHTLTTGEMPSHRHDYKHGGVGGVDSNPAGGGYGVNNPTQYTQQTEYAGGGAAHNNLQPYIVSLFIQKL